MRRRHVRFLVLEQPRRPGSTGANVGLMVKLATDVLGQEWPLLAVTFRRCSTGHAQ